MTEARLSQFEQSLTDVNRLGREFCQELIDEIRFLKAALADARKEAVDVEELFTEYELESERSNEEPVPFLRWFEAKRGLATNPVEPGPVSATFERAQ